MKSGIYAILNTCNNKTYIGQSKSVKQRIARHKSELKHNKHRNIYLQREYNKYGEECFVFKVLEFCEEYNLSKSEKLYIEIFRSNFYNKGFNLTNGGESTVWNDEAKKRRTGSGNPMYKRKLSKEHVEALRIANLGSSDKITAQQVEDIKNKLLKDEEIKNIAKEYQVTTSTIHKIYSLKNWYWVAEELNEKLTEKRNKRHTDIAERNKKILQDYNNGATTKTLVEKYKVSRHVVGNVVNPRKK